MKNLQNKCCWKDIAEFEKENPNNLVPMNEELVYCLRCSGYDKNCKHYIVGKREDAPKEKNR